MLFRGIKEIKL